MAKLVDVKRRKKGFAGPPMARKGRPLLASAQRTGGHVGRRPSQREDVGMLLEQLAMAEALLDYCRR